MKPRERTRAWPDFAELLSLAVLLLAFAAPPVRAAEPEFVYRTVRNDTLIHIARRFLLEPGDWRLLQERNRIANPRSIPVGTAIRIPLYRMRHEPREIEVETVRGAAVGAAGPIAAGARLAEGAQLSTAGNGFVTLRLADGSRINVPSSSRIQVERSRSYGDASVAEIVLRLVTGRLETSVRPQRASDRFLIRANQAVTAVRGTRFRVALQDSGAAATEVTEGVVAVDEESVGRPIDVGVGFGTRVAPGQAPIAPVSLLAPPDATRVPPLFERTLVRIPFGSVGGATAYRAQVAQDAQFVAIVAEGRFEAPEAKFSDLADGEYFIRLRAIDGLGLEGLDVARAFRLKARPEPPFVSGPADRAKLRVGEAKLAWSMSTEAASYRVQVSASPEFSTPAVEEAGLAEPGYAARSLGPGTWHWRVASVRANGEAGPWGDTRQFTIVPEPPAPKAGPAPDGGIAFEWPGEPGQRYQFQLAGDAEFSNVTIDRTLEEPGIRLADIGAGTHYFRMRAIDPDGFRGPYSAAQRIDVPFSSWWLLLLLLPLLPL